MNIYQLYGTCINRKERTEQFEVTMTVIAEDKIKAKGLFQTEYQRSDSYQSYFNRRLEWEGKLFEVHGIEDFNMNKLLGNGVAYYIPLMIKGYAIDGYGDWEDMFKEITEASDDILPRIRRIDVDIMGPDIKQLTVFMEGKPPRESTVKAFKDCERAGVDPYGY